MRPRLPRSWKARLIAAVVVAAAGFAAWQFVLGGEDSGPGGPGDAEAAREMKREGPAALSISEQVDQVLMLGFEGTDGSAPIASQLSERGLGALVVRDVNWGGLAGGKEMLASLREAAAKSGAPPPLIAVAQEGGVYRSLGDLPPAERALDVGRSGSVAGAREWAEEATGALREAGFHLDLFPVADVGTLDSPVAGRTFSDDAEAVAALTEASLKGCAESGLACAPLHFPGLGAASQDTALGPATVSLDPASLAERDLAPFRVAIREKAPALVVSVALYSAYDAVVPGALTPAVADTLLRGQEGYRGVAISDDLSAGAVQATYRTRDAAIEALRAGIDLIQISEPADQEGVAEALVAAVESGEVPRERLAEAVERVLELKRRHGLTGSAERE